MTQLLYTDRSDYIECIPNVSEGKDLAKITEMCQIISAPEGTTLLHVDAQADANRTVFTFCGDSSSVLKSAADLARYCAQTIDMREHRGEHPCIGALDVCPFVNLGTMDEAELLQKINLWASDLAADLSIPIYLYEKSARKEQRKNLANIRKGNYQKLKSKMNDPEWAADFHSVFSPRFGAMVTGLREFLVAFNISFPSLDLAQAKKIAALVRHSSSDSHRLEGVKAIGWYMASYKSAQVSLNITDLVHTSLYDVMETVVSLARGYDPRLSYSTELIGLMPRYYLQEAIDDYGLRDFDALVSRILLKYKGWGIPTIEDSIASPPGAEELLKFNF